MKRWFAFIPLFILLLIGSGLITAVLNIQQKLPNSLDQYYAQTNTFDLLISCDNGFTQYDIDTLSSDSSIDELEEFWSVEYPAVVATNNLVLQAYSLNDTISTFQIVNGRSPESASECLIDELLVDLTGVKIGDKITLDPSSSFGDTILTVDQLTIVGICHSNFYTSYDRQFSDEETSVNYCYLVLNKDAFIRPANIMMLTKSNESVNSDDFFTHINELFTECLKTDYQSLIAEPVRELSANNEKLYEINNKLTSLSEEAENVEDSYFQIWKDAAAVSEAARAEIEEKRQALYYVDYSKEDADIALANNEIEVTALEDITKEARDAYTSTVKDYNIKINELDVEISSLSETILELQSLINSIETNDFTILSKNSLASYHSYTQESTDITESIESISKQFFILLAISTALLATLLSLGFVNAVSQTIQKNEKITSIIFSSIILSSLWSITGVIIGSYLGFRFVTSMLYDFFLSINKSVDLANTDFNFSITSFVYIGGTLVIGFLAFISVFVTLLLLIYKNKKRKQENV